VQKIKALLTELICIPLLDVVSNANRSLRGWANSRLAMSKVRNQRKQIKGARIFSSKETLINSVRSP
jgi:hypothetical protein